MQRLAPYDGSSVWEAYRTQFGLLAGLNKWTDQEKAAYLAISLQETALTVLTDLPEDQRHACRPGIPHSYSIWSSELYT